MSGRVKSASCVLVLAMSGCVTTQTVDLSRSPDPRDDLPLTHAEQRSVQAAQKNQPTFATFATVIDTKFADPIVNIRVLWRAGSSDDAVGKEGLAALTAALMRSATQQLSTSELSDALFPWAAELTVNVDKDTIAFVGRVHKDHVAAFTSILLDVLLHPRMDAGDFARLKHDATAYLETTLRSANEEALQRETLEALIYDRDVALQRVPRTATPHGYRHTPTGTVRGLASITVQDAIAFRAATLTRDRVMLGVSGGADALVVQRLVDGLMSLPPTSPRADVVAPPAPSRNVALLVQKPAASTAISVGFALPELSRAHPDYAAMLVAQTWFGEHRNLIVQLLASMRETGGFNDGDDTDVEHVTQAPGTTAEELSITRRTEYFSMRIRPVQNQHRLFALRQILWQLDSFVKSGIPDDDSFARAQKLLCSPPKVGEFALRYSRAQQQEPMRRLGDQMDAVLTGEPFDADGLRARIRKLTRADVNAAVSRHLHADRLSIVVVTPDAQALKTQILDRVSASMHDMAAPFQHTNGEDARIDTFDVALAADDIVIVPPDALFAQ